MIAAAGPAVRTLPVARDSRIRCPSGLGFSKPRVCLPGILVVEGPAVRAGGERGPDTSRWREFCAVLQPRDAINVFPLIVVVDDSDFASRTLENFLWTTFTRSNPAADVYGIEAFVLEKHWGCRVAGDRRPGEAAPCAAAGRRPGGRQTGRRPGRPGGPLHGIV